MSQSVRLVSAATVVVLAGLAGVARLQAEEISADVAALRQLLTPLENVDRPAIVARLRDAALKRKAREALPAIEAAAVAARRYAILAAEVKQAGGTIEFASAGPGWLREAAGDKAMRLFDVPVAINLYNGNNPLKGKGGLNTAINDAWLQRLRGLTTLTTLDLANCDVHRAGLEHVATLTSLVKLNLTLTPVTDDDLAPLASLTQLEQFSLASTACTGEGFARLTSLVRLQNLNMHHAETNDAGLAAIARVGDLERLWIAHTHFTDASARHLAAHENLRRLGIGSKSSDSSGAVIAGTAKLPLAELELYDRQATDEALQHAAKIATLRYLNVSYGPTVTDAALPAIAQMPALEELRIYGALITDEGLAHLAGLKSLKRLTLLRLKHITPAGIRQLQAARPDLKLQTMP